MTNKRNELDVLLFSAKLDKLAEILDEDDFVEQVGLETINQLGAMLKDWSLRQSMEALIDDDFNRLDGLLESLGEDVKAIAESITK